MEVLSKDMIQEWIIPHLSKGKRGPKPSVELCEIVQLIFYRLKTGCQWRMLPLGAFLNYKKLKWMGVYYHHYRWVKEGSWKKAWIALLKANRTSLDLSSMQLDGSQTLCKKQGEHIAYHGRRKARTTNALFLADNEGQPLAMATPQAGNHNDLFDIKGLFEEMCNLLQQAGIDLKGVFMNADAGFDAQVVREQCEEKQIEANIAHNDRNKSQSEEQYLYFDEQLYQRRFLIERANAWLDGFKALLVRYEVKIKTWMAEHFMAFSILFIRKILKC